MINDYWNGPKLNTLEHLWSISKHMRIFKELAKEKGYSDLEIKQFMESKTSWPPSPIIEDIIKRQEYKKKGVEII